MKKIVCIALTTSLLCAANAAAEDQAEQLSLPTFADVDSNADLYIDRQEFEEFGATMRAKLRQRFSGGPRGGGEGGVKPGDRLYAAADIDEDGMLNESEFAALQARMQEKREKMRRRWAERGSR